MEHKLATAVGLKPEQTAELDTVIVEIGIHGPALSGILIRFFRRVREADGGHFGKVQIQFGKAGSGLNLAEGAGESGSLGEGRAVLFAFVGVDGAIDRSGAVGDDEKLIVEGGDRECLGFVRAL